MNARTLSMLVACVGAAAGLTACDSNVTSSATVVHETLSPISCAYVVDSGELTEISGFEDDSVKYTPTGWIVASPPTTGTATAAALRQ